MSNVSGGPDYGRALFRYLEALWEAEGATPTQWALRHGLSGPQLTRWKSGQTPGIEYFRRIADATGRPILDVLVGAEVLSSDEAGGYEVAPAASASAPISELIDRASDLTDGERQAVREAVNLVLRAMRGGPGGTARIGD